MCRLFGMSAGDARVHASFWLLDAPDSLQMQGRRNRDGTGLGFFDESGRAVVDKQAEAAYSDVAFIQDARTVSSTTFVAHVRIATTGELSLANCHPFVSDGRIMAHNGGFEELDRLEAQLGDYLGRVEGDTDSERYLALVTQCIERNGGDVGAGISGGGGLAGRERAALLAQSRARDRDRPVGAALPRSLQPVRPAPAARRSRRRCGARREQRHARASSSTHLAERAAIVVASERMDESPDWRLMEPGELLHVAPDLTVESKLVLPDSATPLQHRPTALHAMTHAPASESEECTT